MRTWCNCNNNGVILDLPILCLKKYGQKHEKRQLIKNMT